ncbi:hypothetical protein LOTGIDRAFT_102200 [Lottia gigantea]|uniref:Ig-like domain-containing protein n=1 Tax=Lottia gigantea TaxID=225164 RepID=V4AN58_LOTGI|nr:hypothetical protein LOTGIDRAFT_102200 [Lottia gigantea]ESP05604.1 hypothetical protein LOTGIDRAFT_102200 [Lottia gigantea]
MSNLNHFIFSAAGYSGYDDYDDGPIPRFKPTRNNYTYFVGELAVLECVVDNLGDKKVVWRKGSKLITVGSNTFVEDARIQIEHPARSNQWNLLIKQVQFKDAGVYECQISSKVRHLRYYVTLLVKGKNIQISGARFVNRGERIILTCNATGREHPPDDLDWFRNGDKLSTNFAQKIYIRKKVNLGLKTIFSRLEIRDAKLLDAGSYVCRTSDLQVTSTRINVLNSKYGALILHPNYMYILL